MAVIQQDQGKDFIGQAVLVGAEAQVRVGKEADRDAKGIRGQVPLVAVGADQAERADRRWGPDRRRGCPERRSANSRRCNRTEVAGDGIDGGLQTQGEVNTEQLGGMRDALVFRDQSAFHDEPQMTGAGQPPR